MNADCLPCLSDAARDVLVPHNVVRVALLGSDSPAQPDLHLLVEFSPAARAIGLVEWLGLQREMRARCGCNVELVSVNRLQERVAAETVVLTVLYDASSDA